VFLSCYYFLFFFYFCTVATTTTTTTITSSTVNKGERTPEKPTVVAIVSFCKPKLPISLTRLLNTCQASILIYIQIFLCLYVRVCIMSIFVRTLCTFVYSLFRFLSKLWLARKFNAKNLSIFLGMSSGGRVWMLLAGLLRGREFFSL
jgi:hypothetical protein